jgi:hypothetical protein
VLSQEAAAALRAKRDSLDPFALSRCIDEKLERIQRLANLRQSPKAPESTSSPIPLAALEKVATPLGVSIAIRKTPGLHPQ